MTLSEPSGKCPLKSGHRVSSVAQEVERGVYQSGDQRFDPWLLKPAFRSTIGQNVERGVSPYASMCKCKAVKVRCLGEGKSTRGNMACSKKLL